MHKRDNFTPRLSPVCCNFPSLYSYATDSLGPPDKAQHFTNDEFIPPPKRSRKGKERVAKSVPKSKKNVENPNERKNVEVYYDDGKWYRGWLDSFNFQTGKWIVVKFE